MGRRVSAALLAMAALSVSAIAQTPPSFSHDIAPIVYQSCAPCHHQGGEAPFPLLTYQDLQKRAAQVATVTRSRYMPPWLPEAGYGDFAGERRLTDAQIRLIADWAAAGAPEGSPAETPAPPQFNHDWQLGQPDLVLQASAPLNVPADGPDLFWNFVFRPQITGPRYVRAVEIHPEARGVVHHANLLIARAGAGSIVVPSGDAGFPGMDLNIVRSPFDPDGHFLFWKPGAAPHVEPDGFAWRLNPGDTLVLNTHLHPGGKPQQSRPSIGIYFTDKPPTRFPLLVQLEHDGALRIPAGSSDFEISDDFRLPMDVDVLAVYPHAHYLGKVLEAYATLPDGNTRPLIRIPDWDLNWQSVYYYREPLSLPQGTIISMRYHYDNSAANPRNPSQPPRAVVNGNQATDEMGHLWLELLPHGTSDRRDRRLELQEAAMRHRLEKYPDDFAASFNLGALSLARLRVSQAVSFLEHAVDLDPLRPEAHNMLGAALARVGRAPEALHEFQLAVEQRPGFVNARLNLANALMRAGKPAEALADYKEVLHEAPDDETVRLAIESRARQLAEEGRTADADALNQLLHVPY